MDYESLARHLIELRSRLIKILFSFILVLLISWYFSQELFAWFCQPTLKYSSAPAPLHTLISVRITAPFTVPLKLAALFSLFIMAPYWLYQIWSFVTPGLYQHEIKGYKLLMASSMVLFYGGAAFGFFLIVPTALYFFNSIQLKYVLIMNDIADYLDFTWQLTLGAGIAFQTPVITHVLLKWGIISLDKLQAARSYVLIIALTLGMLLTPPDVMAQVLLACPIYMLFELGVVSYRLFQQNP